jgi:ABC-type Fe3+-hydroxamate transport system substrate-binding protein
VHRIRSLIPLGLALAALTLALAGCSGSVSVGDESSPSSADGGTTTSTTTYTNDEYGFSITYDEQLSQGEPVAGTGAGGSSVLDVVFADQEGPVVADRYVNAVQVSVYELAREVKPSEVPGVEEELQGVVDQIVSSLPAAEVVEELSPAEVNGVPGFALKYTYAEEETPITAVTFFLFSGTHEYQITAQATTADWQTMKGTLEAAVNSFTVR